MFGLLVVRERRRNCYWPRVCPGSVDHYCLKLWSNSPEKEDDLNLPVMENRNCRIVI